MEPHAEPTRPDHAGTGPPGGRDGSGRSPRPGGRAPGRGLPLGRILGFPVYVNSSWILIAALVTYTYAQFVQAGRPGVPAPAAYAVGFGFVLCLLLSVLLHELGHALVSRRYGIGVRGITLEMLGGYTEMDRDAPRPRVELVISLAGPVVSLLVGGAAAGAAALLPAGTIVHGLAFQLALSNIVVAVFNALPGLPLDGGQALRAVVWAVRDDRWLASLVAGWSGRVIAAACALAAVTLYALRVFSVFGLILTGLVAVSLWAGASQAILLGRIGPRLRLVDLTTLARPIFGVPTGTPLAEARRRAEVSGAHDAALAVTDTSGRLVALVDEPAAHAVAPQRRPWVAVDAVSRGLDPGRTLSARLTGDELLQAVQDHPAPEYLVTAGQDVIGVLRVVDLSHVLDPKTAGNGRTRQRTTR